jgi:hypothetical protein
LEEVFVDAFWLIPLAIVVIAFVWIFCAHMKKLPSSPCTPHVLVDKPPDEHPIDQDAGSRDWSKRPSGSYLDWLFGRGK